MLIPLQSNQSACYRTSDSVSVQPKYVVNGKTHKTHYVPTIGLICFLHLISF